jgi:hypothetical protein
MVAERLVEPRAAADVDEQDGAVRVAGGHGRRHVGRLAGSLRETANAAPLFPVCARLTGFPRDA